MPDQDFNPSSEDIANYLKSNPTPVQNSQTQPSAFSQLWPYAAGVAAPALAKAGAALAGKVSPMLSALFLSKPIEKFYNRNTGRTSYTHDIFDDQRSMVGPVGNTHLMYDPRNDHIHIQSIDAYEPTSLPIGHPAAQVNKSSQVFGQSDMRSLLRSLQQQYPYARSIGGERISGARWGPASSDDNMSMKTIMRLPETPERKADRLYQEEMWRKKYGSENK